VPRHLPNIDGSTKPLLNHRHTSENPLANKYRPYKKEDNWTTTLLPESTCPRHRRRLQQHQPNPPPPSDATMWHATLPVRLDTCLHYQSKNIFLLRQAGRRPETISLWPTSMLTSLPSPFPHLGQCDAGGTTHSWL
jgi:hypothetical protein